MSGMIAMSDVIPEENKSIALKLHELQELLMTSLKLLCKHKGTRTRELKRCENGDNIMQRIKIALIEGEDQVPFIRGILKLIGTQINILQNLDYVDSKKEETNKIKVLKYTCHQI